MLLTSFLTWTASEKRPVGWQPPRLVETLKMCIATSDPRRPNLARQGTKRTSRHLFLFVLAGAALLAITVLAACRGSASEGARSASERIVTSDSSQTSVPSTPAFRRARRFASHRSGTVSFAVIDTSARLRCYRCNKPYLSASVVKAMLLVGYLDEISERDLPLTASHRAFLEAMIRRSDNASADVIYDHVGDAALSRLAARAEMTRFAVNGDWTSARITAAEQAHFFARIVTLTPATYRDYAAQLLASVVRSQTWGIPEIARPQWTTMFKGGWRHTSRGHLVHQVARLDKADLSVAIAVLTDGNPSDAYGRATIRGIAARLLGTERRPGHRPGLDP